MTSTTEATLRLNGPSRDLADGETDGQTDKLRDRHTQGEMTSQSLWSRYVAILLV